MKPATRLLRWYDAHGRKLPWRRTRQAYRILVSEVMLQQTQVERVKTYYRSWFKAFPNWRVLAEASNADVLHAWAGLGYNRRALALRDIARHVVEHGEPKSREEWLALKGVGPYTSAAIMAFAHRQPLLPIDTNIRRFAGRYLLGKPYPTAEDDKALMERSGELLDVKRAHDVPQAIFDLATMHCTKVPDCAVCPMQNSCPAAQQFLSGDVQVPGRMTKASKEKRYRGKRHPDRIYRGRILKIVRESDRPVLLSRLGPAIDKTYVAKQDFAWIEAMVGRLEKDGMVKRIGARVKLG